jgi:hypothetical protein
MNTPTEAPTPLTDATTEEFKFRGLHVHLREMRKTAVALERQNAALLAAMRGILFSFDAGTFEMSSLATQNAIKTGHEKIAAAREAVRLATDPPVGSAAK